MRLRRQTAKLHELVASFSGRERRLSCEIRGEERERLLELLDEGLASHRFLALSPRPGCELFLNTAHLRRLNILDPLPGLQVEVDTPPEPDDAGAVAEPGSSDATVHLRVWLRGDEQPIDHTDIAAEDWAAICHALDNGARFIAFTDEDLEEVLYGTDHLDAIEMLDPAQLTEEQLDILLNGEPAPDLPAPATPPSPKPDDVPF